MSRVYCPCGHCISDVQSPCPDYSYLLTEDQVFAGDIDPIDQGRGVWHCRECGRIAIHASPESSAIEWFTPQDKELDELDRRFKMAMDDKFDAYNETINALRKDNERLRAAICEAQNFASVKDAPSAEVLLAQIERVLWAALPAALKGG